MNVENINKLIDHLKKIRPENFDMTHWLGHFPRGQKVADVLNQMETVGGCGTTACLAGHAAIIMAVETSRSSVSRFVSSDACYWLGLSEKQACLLFYETDGSLTPEETIPVLEHLRDTGEVNWGLAYESRPARLNPYANKED